MVPSRSRVSESSKARREAATASALQPLRLGGIGDGNQGDLDVVEAGQHRLAIELQILELQALCVLQLPFQREAVKDRLRQLGGNLIKRGLRREQQLEHRALIAALSGERDAREKCGTGGFHAGVGGSEVGLGCANVGSLEQELGRQTGRYHWNSEPEQAAALHDQVFRRAANEQRERGDVLAQRLVERGNGGAHRRHQRLLLGDIERGCRAGAGALLDQGENATGRGQVLVRGPQPVLRLEHQEIGGGDAHDGGKDDHLLVEAGGDRAFLEGARGRGVLAPEIELIAGVEHGGVKLALGRAAGAGAARTGGL